MKTREHERRDYVIIIALILLLGFICIILASGWALRFPPSWRLFANMNSNLNPDSDFLTSRPVGFIEPLDPSILTNPVWLDVFLTPGSSFSTRIPLPTGTFTQVPPNTNTLQPQQPTQTLNPTPTNTFIPISTNTRRPRPTAIQPTPTRTPPIILTNSATVTATVTNTLTSTATFTPIPPSNVDLRITKTDNVTTYTPGGAPLVYSIVVTNPTGPSNAIGAIVRDTFPAQITSAVWSCNPAGGAACTANGSGNINDTVNIPVGGSLTYSVTGNTSPNAAGTIDNVASVIAPTGFTETAPGDNSATDSDTSTSGEPGIGGPDGIWITIPTGTSITLLFSPPIVADGDVGTPDFVYYERLATPVSIDLDWVQVEISMDGITWYQVFYWGDGIPDTNTNVDINVIGGAEADNRSILATNLYNSTGITVDVDGLVPPGNYSWMRITSPVGGANGANVDAIQPYYP